MTRLSLGEAMRLAEQEPLDPRTRSRMRENLIRETEILLKPQPSRPRFVLWGALAAACLVVGLAFVFGGKPRALQEEIAAHHDKMVATGPGELQVRGDEADLADYFQKSLGFRPVFPARKSPEVTIVGGRVCSIQGQAVAYAVYQWRGHLISYFGQHPDAPHSVGESGGQGGACTIVPIHAPSGDACVAADLPRDDLDKIFDWRAL